MNIFAAIYAILLTICIVGAMWNLIPILFEKKKAERQSTPENR